MLIFKGTSNKDNKSNRIYLKVIIWTRELLHSNCYCYIPTDKYCQLIPPMTIPSQSSLIKSFITMKLVLETMQTTKRVKYTCNKMKEKKWKEKHMKAPFVLCFLLLIYNRMWLIPSTFRHWWIRSTSSATCDMA